MNLIFFYCILFLIGVFGAFITKKVQIGELPVWTPIFPSILSGVVWDIAASNNSNNF